jgi:hypothetical protein
MSAVPKSSSDLPASPLESKTGPGESRAISRRHFGRNAAFAAAASISAPALLAVTSAAPAPAQDQTNEPLKGLTPQQTADVDTKLANILRKYGDRFSDEQKKHLRKILAQHQRLLAPVREFALKNGDPPVTVLRVSFDRLSQPKQGGAD